MRVSGELLVKVLVGISLCKVQIIHSIRRGCIGRHGIEGFCTTSSTEKGASIEYSDEYKCKTQDTRSWSVDPSIGEGGDWLRWLLKKEP